MKNLNHSDTNKNSFLKFFLKLVSLFGVMTVLFTPLYAITLSIEDFNSNDEGWSGGTRCDNHYCISGDNTGSKDYSFNQHPLRNVIITFDVRAYNGWEASGDGQDVLNVTANGVTTRFYQEDGTYTYSVNAVLDTNGDLELRINPDTASYRWWWWWGDPGGEDIWIDNVVISFISADAINDSYSIVKNTVLSGNVLSNDIGPSISVISNTNPSHGAVTVNANGTFTYTPTSNYMGDDSFTYTIEDSNGYSDTGTVSITITNVATSGYRDFSLRQQLYSKGDMKTIGNTVLVPPTTQNSNICSTYTNGDYIENAPSSNAAYYLCEYNVDTTTPSLTNSTTSELRLPSGARVIWAGLYWQAIVSNFSFSTDMTIKIRHDESSSSYTDITPDRLDYKSDAGYSGYTSYSAFADVSGYFGDGKWNDGNYTVANIPVYEGNIPSLGTYGAWTLAVVYANLDDPNEKFRSFSIFDGWKTVGSGDPSVNIDVTGFYTPDKNNIVSEVSVFAAEGDRHISGDLLKTINYNNNTAVTLATITNNSFNSSISGGDSRTPDLINNNGIDIQTFDIGDYMIPKQTTMNFTFTSERQANGDQDRYWPSMIGFATELYVPQFCYDYGYEQNGLPFTEENNGTAMPYISGFLPNTTDIDVSLYIRNQEASDVSANNIIMTINDINTSQAIYTRDTVGVNYPNSFTPVYKEDSAWPLSVSNSYIHNIPIGDMGGEQHAYVYYTLTPQHIGTIDIPIDATFSYDLVIPLPNGSTLTLPYSSTVGGENLPMCSADNFSYTPEWGIFSMVDAGLYDSNNDDRYYDLTTQVAKRPGNLRIASFDPEALDTPQPVTTIVAVELIDASEFHDVDAACREPSSAISPRIWMTFENNVSQVDFNAQTIQAAINEDMVSDVITGQPYQIGSPADFFQTATPNAAFRVSFNTIADQNDSLIHIEETKNGIRIDNFSDIHQIYPHCRQYVKNPNNDNMTNLTSVACSDNGNNSTYQDVAICMECLYGTRTKVLCSRDNFAIRPESYTVQLRDLNQTDHTQVQLFAPGHTGVTSPDISRVDVASGYDYRFDVNATNHLDNQATPGYTRYFATGGSDYNITLIWEPSVAKTGCNDTEDESLEINLINGTVATEENLSQVGKYRLNIIDKTWTIVDWDSSKQTHQTGSHFLSGFECDPNSTDVPLESSVTSLSGSTINNVAGCNISSTHDNIENGLKYKDYLFEFHPYKFVLNITPSAGLDYSPSATHLYMADISMDENMSFHLNGDIRASGYNNSFLSNFVNNCYAKPLNLTVHKSDTALVNVNGNDVAYRARFHNLDVNGTLIAADDINYTETNSSMPVLIQTSQSYFTKNFNGTIDTRLNLNYNREVNAAASPKLITFGEYDVDCIDSNDCSFIADFETKITHGFQNLDHNITHLYGRTHASRQRYRVPEDDPYRANIYFEAYCFGTNCDKTLLPNGLSSNNVDDLRWFINADHNTTNDGAVGIVLEKIGTNVAGDIVDATDNPTGNPSVTTLDYDESKGYPYKTTMQNEASRWLIYNEDVPTATRNEFQVEFDKLGDWTGEHETDTTTKSTGGVKTNRRIMW
jgi:hypothetical protein